MSFKRYLVALLSISLAATVAFLAASEWLLRTQVDREDLFNAQLELFHQAKGRGVRNAAFGDSAIARGFLPPSPDFIDLGLGGESHYRTAIKLRAFFDDRPAGKVLLVASPHSLLVNDPTDFGDFYKNAFSSGSRPALRIFELRNRFFIFRFWRAFLSSAELEAHSAFGPNGGLHEKSPAAEAAYARRPPEQRRKYSQALLEDYERKPKYWDHVRSVYGGMVEFLKKRGAQICLVGFPYSASFRRAAEGNQFMNKQVPEFWHAFSSKYAVKYVNLFDYFDNDTFFLNETHVNTTGARIITGEILNRCFADR